MKYSGTISSLMICLLLFQSCTKTDNQANSNTQIAWSEKLKGSAWAGEFKYTSGDYTGLQPFSIIINNDSTLTWFEIIGNFPASWKATGNKVTIKFPSGSTVAADVTNDNWSNFTNITNHPWVIENLSQSALPKPDELARSVWSGKYKSTNDLSLTFLPSQKLGFLYAASGFTEPYIINGAGVKFTHSPMVGFNVVSYGVFVNPKSMKGCDMVATTPSQYILWNADKP